MRLLTHSHHQLAAQVVKSRERCPAVQTLQLGQRFHIVYRAERQAELREPALRKDRWVELCTVFMVLSGFSLGIHR